MLTTAGVKVSCSNLLQGLCKKTINSGRCHMYLLFAHQPIYDGAISDSKTG